MRPSFFNPNVVKVVCDAADTRIISAVRRFRYARDAFSLIKRIVRLEKATPYRHLRAITGGISGKRW
jgi:CMP-2-keto-3-deoxyoctulosonic acid synthetase